MTDTLSNEEERFYGAIATRGLEDNNILLRAGTTVISGGSGKPLEIPHITSSTTKDLIIDRDVSAMPGLPVKHTPTTSTIINLDTIEILVHRAKTDNQFAHSCLQELARSIGVTLGEYTAEVHLDTLAKIAVEAGNFDQVTGDSRSDSFPSLSTAVAGDNAVRKKLTKADLWNLTMIFDAAGIPNGNINNINQARVLVLPPSFSADLTEVVEYADVSEYGVPATDVFQRAVIANGWLIVQCSRTPVFTNSTVSSITAANQVDISKCDRGDAAFVANSRECALAFYAPNVLIGRGPVNVVPAKDPKYDDAVRWKTSFGVGLGKLAAKGVYALFE